MLDLAFQCFKYFLTVLLWPLPQIFTMLRLLTGFIPNIQPEFKAIPVADIKVHFAGVGRSLRHFYMACLCVFWMYPNNSYPALTGEASTFALSWIWPIIFRNVVGTFLICGFWDWWLYFGPVKEHLFKYKIVPKYPSFYQMKHDYFYTTLSSILAGCLEILMCHWFANGTVAMSRSLWDKPLIHAALILGIPYWRDGHFFIMHRLMHPWKLDYVPDIGKVLYKWIHSLHHKSYNITAFSGTNMHPLESLPYYGSALCVLPFGVHPVIAVTILVDCAVAAWAGHDGHVWPAGSGNYYHSLHHGHFDCNYGTNTMPLDYVMGTFAATKEDIPKIWGKKEAGISANDTFIHEDSLSKRVE